MQTCFVIMPYGGDSEEKKRHYTGVYESVIKAAIERVGLSPRRSDTAGEPGNIPIGIIKDLATAEIVIADLTDANANVFFELGIRHVLRKSGTVHIVDKRHAIPFDVAQYRAVKYSTELADLNSTIDEIAKAITKRLASSGPSDNPVHDALPFLPSNTADLSQESLGKQIAELGSLVKSLQKENEQLRERIGESRLYPVDSEPFSNKTIDEVLDEAEEVRRSTGEHALLRLNDAMQSGGPDAFAAELRMVLKSPYLAENDFAEIATMCMRRGLAAHQRATLDVGARRFRGNTVLAIALADACLTSGREDLELRGQRILEDYLNIKHEHDGPALGDLKGKGQQEVLHVIARLCDQYHSLGRADWVLRMTTSAEEKLGANSILIRNRARALAKLSRPDEAEAEFKRAIALDRTDDSAHSFYAEYLVSCGRLADALAEFELAVINDPEDGSRIANLGIYVLNSGYTRDADGKMLGPLERRQRIRHAFPLLRHAVQDRHRAAMLRPLMVGVLVRAEAMEEAQAISRMEEAKGEYDRGYLDYLLKEIMKATP